jgi:hypothetical protein
VLKNNGQTTYALKGGNSQSGGLSTWWNGALPNRGGYIPMHQEGSHHPGHRRRQQQPQHGHLLRGRR